VYQLGLDGPGQAVGPGIVGHFPIQRPAQVPRRAEAGAPRDVRAGAQQARHHRPV